MRIFTTLLIFLWIAPWLAPLSAQCSFNASDLNPCATESITFTVDNPGMATYGWDMDDDGTIDLNGPQVTFEFPVNFQDTDYVISLFENGTLCTSQTITVLATPDPALGIPPGIVTLNGNSIQACNGNDAIELKIYNASQTYLDNAGYTINWGDGSPNETFDNNSFSNSSTISHTYSGLGYYTIFLTATHQNGCTYTTTYTFYNGGNPSVGIVIPGNTVGLCAPATLEFPITNTQNNPPGTVYTVYINGDTVAQFDQTTLPSVFEYTFTEGSCNNSTSTGNYINAFDVQIVASNPCNSSTATIEPIEISEPPSPEFVITPPPGNCPGEVFEFENTTSDVLEVVSGNPSSCVETLNPTWTISPGQPGTDWEVVSGSLFGSNNVGITFLEPGVYVIDMVVISFACGEFTFSDTVTISEPPEIEADALTLNVGDGCVPLEIPFETQATGVMSYDWSINPPTGWQFIDNTDASSSDPLVQFTEGGTYLVTLTAGNNCQEVSWDTLLVLNGTPNLNLNPIPDACYNATLNFSTNTIQYDSNGTAILSYQWNFPGASITLDTTPYPSDIQYNTPGSYTVNLEVTNACGTTSIADTFEVQQPESLVLPPDLELCMNEDPLQLQAMPLGGSWSGPGIQSNGTFQPAVAGPGTFQLMYSYGVGACLVDASLEATVHPVPTVDAGPDLFACANDPALALNASPVGGTWLSPGGIASGGEWDPQVSGPGQFEVIYAFTDANSCSNVDSLEIQIHDLPTVLASDTSFCFAPGLVTLPTGQPAGGVYIGNGVVSNILLDPALLNGPGNYPLDYQYTDQNGCTNSDPITVQLQALPTVLAGPDAVLCIEAGATALPNAIPAGGSWSGPGILDQQAGIFEPLVAGGGLHTLTYTYGTGNCQVADDIEVEVINLTGIAAGPPVDACPNDAPFQLTGNTPLGGQWSGPGILNPNTGLFDPSQVNQGTITVQYSILDVESGCTASSEKELTVHPLPTPAFETPPMGCVYTPIEPINQSTGADSYSWSFGDGQSAQAVWPTHSYQTTGTFTIQLVATNQFGCSLMSENEIFIAEPPTAAFETNGGAGCGPLLVQLVDQSSGYDFDYFWNFGNGQTALSPPTNDLLYPAGFNDTTYTITLEVSNFCGSDILEEEVEVYADPVSHFGMQVDTGCAPMEVILNNVSLGSPVAFLWDFGNGNTSTDSLPPPQWYSTDTTIANYTIALVVTNQCGSDTSYQQVTVEPESVTSFFNTNDTEGCQPFTVDFTNYSTFGTTVTWDFGDGNQTTAFHPSHTFTEAGTYQVIQYITNGCGSDSSSIQIEVIPEPEVAFEVPEVLCSNHPVQFVNNSLQIAGAQWDFGDGGTSTLLAPTHLFEQAGTYQVQLTGFAAGSNCPATTVLPITIHTPPVAAAAVNITDGCTPLTVQFSNTSQDAQYYSWNFGDGNNSVSPAPSHTFHQAGTYDVSLVVSAVNGCQDTTLVDNLFAYPLPEAGFSFEKDQKCGLPVGIDFFNETIGGEGFVWKFGEGPSSNLVNPSHTFEEPGTVEVQLLASNQYGCLDTAVQLIPLYLQPIAEIGVEPVVGCSPLEVPFTNGSQDADGYRWNFGDGLSSDDPNPTHQYREAGWYPIELIASYQDECFDTLRLAEWVHVLQSPTANFDYQINPANQPSGSVQFFDLSENAPTRWWDFGDGTNSQAPNPVHRYYEDGLVEVKLEVAADNGCIDDTLMYLVPPVYGRLFVPNAFSPEQGLGDARVFLPKGIGLAEYQLQIFSTYGQLLWQSSLLEDGQPAEAWDGTYRGNLLPQDTYVWKVHAIFEDGTVWNGMPDENGRLRKLGAVVLLR